MVSLCPGPLSRTLPSLLGSILCSHGSGPVVGGPVHADFGVCCLSRRGGQPCPSWSPNPIEYLFPKVYRMLFVVVIQLLSCIQFFAIPWTTPCQAPLSSAVSQSLLRLMSVESVIPSNHLILCCPLLLFSLFQHQGLSQWVTSLHQVAKLLKLQHQSFQWIFRIDWFDLQEIVCLN